MKAYKDTITFMAEEMISSYFDGANDYSSPYLYIVSEIYELNVNAVEKDVDAQFEILKKAEQI